MRLVRGSLVAAMLALPAWLVLEASAIAEAANARQALAAIPTVLFSTSFGRVLIAQALTLLAAILAVKVQQSPQWRLATVGFAGLATVLEAGHSHAFAIEDGPSLLLFSQSVHLLAAGAWLGGLAPLLTRGARRHAEGGGGNATTLFRSRGSLSCRDRGNRRVAGLAPCRRHGRPDQNSLWVGAPAEADALRRAARACGRQPLSPYTSSIAPGRPAWKEGIDLDHRGRDRAWALGCASDRSAKQP